MTGKVVNVPINSLVASPDNVRTQAPSQEHISLLAVDIDEHGLLHPPSVLLREDGMYEVVAGLRRVEAVRSLGWDTVPCRVLEGVDDAFRLSFSENMQRTPMPKLDTCRAIERYLTQNNGNVRDVARLMNLAESTVRRYSLLASLDDDTLKKLDSSGDERLTIGEAVRMARGEPVQEEVQSMAPTGTDAPPPYADDQLPTGEAGEGETAPKKRKKGVKTEPWVYDMENKPTAIPEELWPSIYRMVVRSGGN